MRKPVTAINTDNFRYLQLLDTIKDLPKAHIDAGNANVLLHSFAKSNGLDVLKAMTYAKKHYPQRTLLNLVDV